MSLSDNNSVVESSTRHHPQHGGKVEDLLTEIENLRLQNETLANLFVAGYQLHASLDSQCVAAAIADVLGGLIGASEFALFVVDEWTDELVLQMGEGVEKRFPDGRVRLGEGIEGRVAETQEAEFGRLDSAEHPTVCIPLVLDRKCVGVIGIYGLLSQKGHGLTSVDHELLNLLATQAPAALVCARLFAGK